MGTNPAGTGPGGSGPSGNGSGGHGLPPWLPLLAMIPEVGPELGAAAEAAEEMAATAEMAGAEAETAAAEEAAEGSLPKNPDDLLDRGYEETSHPQAAANGHRTFENPTTGDKVRFDQGTPREPGYEGVDHYHRYNPNSTGKMDQYLDSNGNPVPRGSGPSHLIP